MTWFFTIISLLGNWFNCRKSIVGFYLWIICNTCWLIYDIKNGIYSRVVLDAVQTGFCFYGILVWNKNKGDVKVENIKEEIARVEKALAETKSPYLKRDYEKYLRKLYKRLKRG